MKTIINNKNIILLTLILISALFSGCAGLEIGGKAGLYRVDEMQSSQKTYRNDTKPLKCMFFDCSRRQQRYENEVQGS